MNKNHLTAVALSVSVLLSGCASRVPEAIQYSGTPLDYDRLQRTESSSGHDVLRWTAPDFRITDYRGVYIEPLRTGPDAIPGKRVSQETLEQVRQYADTRLRSALSERTTVLPERSGSRVLLASVTLTAITAENEDIKFYEVIPVAAVIAGTMAVTGHRTQNTALFTEIKLTDQDSGKTVLEVARKGYGKSVSNASTPVTADDVKQAIDDLAKDVVNFQKAQ